MIAEVFLAIFVVSVLWAALSLRDLKKPRQAGQRLQRRQKVTH